MLFLLGVKAGSRAFTCNSVRKQTSVSLFSQAWFLLKVLTNIYRVKTAIPFISLKKELQIPIDTLNPIKNRQYFYR